MAYTGLLSVAQLIEEILPHDQYYSIFCRKEQLISLHQNIISLQQFLEVAPQRYTSTTNQLEVRLADIIYQVEHLIESNVKGSPCTTLAVAGESKTKGWPWKGWLWKKLLGDRTSLTSTFSHCIEQVNSILQEAMEMKELFQQNKRTSSGHYSQTTCSSAVTHGIRMGTIVGMDEDVRKICERLTNYEKSLHIIPIVGMGGIGKTTLAGAVYELIVHHFDVCFWVTISQEYNVQDILWGLLPGEIRPTSGQTEQNAESLIEHVYKSLYGRRFLIVLDDIWHAEAWDCVMRAIPKNENGSRVILTTRLSVVAAKIDSSSPMHQMKLLRQEESWDLLREKVYGRESFPSEFKGVGRRIAGNCKGLPLAIVIVAGLLKANRTYSYWEEVARNVNEAASRNDQLDGILTLSYNNLPPHLKSCFLYMVDFSKDFRIKANILIWLWVAEGFVKPRAPKSLEDIAEEYLEDLVERSLVLITAYRSDGKIRSCSIHDVLRDLGLLKAKEEKSVQLFSGRCIDPLTLQNSIMSKRCLRVSSTGRTLPLTDNDACNTSIRSLLYIDRPPRGMQLSLITSHFRLLKVLGGVEVSTENMFSQLFELTNLRLLHFSHCNYGRLVVPELISKLQKLEMLCITPGTSGGKLLLPVDVWRMTKLRHMSLSSHCTLLFPVLSRDYPLVEHLQTLLGVVNFEFSRSVIKRMPSLKRLKICYTDGLSPTYVAQYCLKNLFGLCELENLHLEFYPKASSNFLPVGFVFPRNIRRLSLQGPAISWDHMSIVGSLPNLEVFKLRYGSVTGDIWEPNEGEFTQLKYLKMEDVSLQHWVVESTHFPCLETLVICKCYMLVEIPLSIGCIDTLQKLTVKNCCVNVIESAEKIQVHQENFGNAFEIFIS